MDLDRDCVLECGPDKTCFPDTCCASKKGKPEETLRQRSTPCAETCSLTDVVTEENTTTQC